MTLTRHSHLSHGLCVPPSSPSRIKETCLPFESFLEALCRMSSLKALPTLDEIDVAGEADAGSFLLNLKELNADRYAAYLADPAHRVEWGDEPRGEAIYQRVEHLIHLLIRTIEGDVTSSSNMQISPAEMKAWAKVNLILKRN